MVGSKAAKRSRVALRAETRAGIGVYRRNLGRDIGLALGTSRGASFKLGDAISVIGIKTVRERERNARKEALTTIARRVYIRWGWRAFCDQSP